MKPIFWFVAIIVLGTCSVLFSNATSAQDEPRAAWLVTNFDITVQNPGSERALSARGAYEASGMRKASIVKHAKASPAMWYADR